MISDPYKDIKMNPARKIYHWAIAKASLPLAPLWLGLIFSSELILFLPLDALLMLFCLQNPQRRFLYAGIATLVSLCVAAIGYGIGLLLWDSIGPFITKHLLSEDSFHRFVQHYTMHAHAAAFFGSLLPIPFKVVTLSAGFCQFSLASFLLFVGLARGVRFFALAEAMNRWEAPIKRFIDRHFNSLVVGLGLKIGLSFLFFWILGNT
jgi:membrane protein YqaA with SNARE-associated domain